MRDFNLKKYLANNPLLNEEEEEIDRFEKIEHVFSGEEEEPWATSALWDAMQ